MRAFSSSAKVSALVGNIKQAAKLSPHKKQSHNNMTMSAKRLGKNNKDGESSCYSTPVRSIETNDDASSNCSTAQRKNDIDKDAFVLNTASAMPRKSFFSMTASESRKSEVNMSSMNRNLFSKTPLSELREHVYTQARSMGTAVHLQGTQGSPDKMQAVDQEIKASNMIESHFELKNQQQRFQQDSLQESSEELDSPQEDSKVYTQNQANIAADVTQPEKLVMTSWGREMTGYTQNQQTWRPSWSYSKDSDASSGEAETVYKVCFVRHGQSIWNKAGKFSGWVDVPLNETGREEARVAGQMLLEQGYFFEKAFTSLLDRATETCSLIVDEMQLQNQIDTVKSWRINERHYGALQGLCKKETADLYGKDQVKKWRQSYHNPPPFIKFEDECHPRFDSLYKDFGMSEHKQMPLGESLKMVRERVTPYWQNDIIPQIEDLGQNSSVLFVAHEHVLRGMVQTLTGIDNTQVLDLRIPNALPFIFEFDENWQPIKNYYITDESTPVVSSSVKESSETRFSTS